MGELLSYSISGGLLMVCMYLAYRVFLARNNQHGFNRGVLLLIYLVSFALPPVCSAIKNVIAAPAMPSYILTGVEAVGGTHSPAAERLWGTALIWIFIAGVIIVAVRTVITWISLTAVIRRAEKIKRQGYTIAITDNDGLAPFSWMCYVVVSRSDFESGCRAIAVHEIKHIACRHWIDLLIAQVVCILNWFNPVAWLMRDELMLVHEYQADMAVLDSGHDVREYQMLLIRKAVGARFPSLANSLNHSKLKKRITMMYKQKSGAGQKMKVLALVPMLALALGVADIPAVSAAISAIRSSEVSVGKVSENPQADKIPAADAAAAQSAPKASNSETKPATTVTYSNNNDNPIGDNTIYVDGKQVTEEEMNKLSPEKIASITVNKQTKAIYITLKKE